MKSQEIADVSTHASEVKSGERFEFGKNWSRFLRLLNDDRINSAVESLKKPAAAAGEAEAAQASKMTRLITRLLGDPNQAPARRQAGGVSKMAEHVSELLKNPKT